MNESIRQKTATQSQRQVGSVPVLFSVRNVQPKIVAAIAQPKPSESPAPDAAPMLPAITPSNPINSTLNPTNAASIAPSEKPKKVPTPSNNRAYNIAVGSLVIAVCLLVIRNTQSSKTRSKESIASNTIASPAESKLLSNLKVELVPPALPSPTAIKPFELEMAGVSSPTPVFSTVSKTSDVADVSPPGPPLTQSALPTLLNSKAAASSAERVAPLNGRVDIIAADSPLSFPAGSVATKNGTLQNNGSSSQPIDLWQTNSTPSENSSTSSHRPEIGNVSAATVEGKTAVVDSNSPTLNSRELYEMKELHELLEMRKAKNTVAPGVANGQTYPETGVRATTVSSISPVSDVSPTSPAMELGGKPIGYKPYYSVDQGSRDPGMMAGRPYSTAPQEFPSLTVPNYERDAMANRQVPPTATQNQMPIRQPSTKDSNRYPTTTQTPYAPLPPAQNGDSFGYPPGK